MKEIRFILDYNDEAFEGEIRKQLTDFCEEIVTIEEHGDAGTTTIIICTIAQALLSVPACILAIKELINWKNSHEKNPDSIVETEADNKSSTETDKTTQLNVKEAQTSWSMVIDGHPFDFSGLPTDYKRSKAFDRVCELLPSLLSNSSLAGGKKSK